MLHRRHLGPIEGLTETRSSSPEVLRVTTSHFSGVVTIRCVAAISALVNCISPAHVAQMSVCSQEDLTNEKTGCLPVSSLTTNPNQVNLFPSF